jgi:hypothetical protein
LQEERVQESFFEARLLRLRFGTATDESVDDVIKHLKSKRDKVKFKIFGAFGMIMAASHDSQISCEIRCCQ